MARYKVYTPKQIYKLQKEWTKKIGIPEEPETEASFRFKKIHNEQVNTDKPIYFSLVTEFMHNLVVTKNRLPKTYHNDLFKSDKTDFSRVLVEKDDYNIWKMHSDGMRNKRNSH